MQRMADSIQSVAGNAQSLASHVDETSSSINEMGASIEQVARSSGHLAARVGEASATIEQMTVSTEKAARNLESVAETVSATSATIEQKVEPPPAPILGRVMVKIGRSYADIHCGDEIAKQAYSKECVFAPGRHRIQARKPMNLPGVRGGFVQEVEVDEKGTVWAIAGGKRERRLIDLAWPVPRDEEEIRKTPNYFKGWKSD